MKNIKAIIVLGFIAGTALFESCVKDLDRVPFYEQTSATVYNDAANYRSLIAKVYAGLAVSGQQGPAGKPDISGNEGTIIRCIVVNCCRRLFVKRHSIEVFYT